MIIVAARPAMGKSTLATGLPLASMKHSITSLRSSRDELRRKCGMRLLSAESGVRLSKDAGRQNGVTKDGRSPSVPRA